MVSEQLAAVRTVRRNVWVYVGLVFVALSWLALVTRIVLVDIGSFDSALDWFYVAMVAGGILASVTGVAASRWRGEGSLALVTLALSLLLPILYVIFFTLLWIILGGAGGGGAGD